VVAVAVFTIGSTSASLWFSIPLHFLAFTAVALRCHCALAADRPPPARLTDFYFWISAGGMLGGLFNALIVPLVFNSVVEYPLALVLGCVAGARQPARSRGTLFGARDLPLPLAVAITTAVLIRAVPRATDDPRLLSAALGVPALMCFSAARARARFVLSVGAMLAA